MDQGNVTLSEMGCQWGKREVPTHPPPKSTISPPDDLTLGSQAGCLHPSALVLRPPGGDAFPYHNRLVVGLSKCSAAKGMYFVSVCVCGRVCMCDKHDDDQPLLYVTFRNTLILLMLHSCCFFCFLLFQVVDEVDYCKRLDQLVPIFLPTHQLQ